MNATPRTLIRQVQKDLTPANGPPTGGYMPKNGEARNLMRAFIGVENIPNAEHTRILSNPLFSGYYPQIIDSVFSLQRYAGDVTRFDNQGINGGPDSQSPRNLRRPDKTSSSVATVLDPYASLNASSFTGFENFLIFINFTLFIGIVLTAVILALFLLFLNNALYLREEIV